MTQANIKIPSAEIKELQKYTGEKTGQKAVRKALLYFLREARQRQIVDILKNMGLKKGFNPLKLRLNER